ncbi:WDR31, partial [Symbiodinium sp. CCMP2456]
DQDLIGTASYDGYIKLWRISTHESVREMYAGKDQLLYGLAFSPNSAKVCAVSSTGLLLIWKVDTGENVV